MINPFSALTSKIFGGIAIAALAFGAVQTVRIDGFLFIKGYKQQLAARDSVIDKMIAAGQDAADKQLAMNAERMATDEATAKESDYEYRLAQGDADAAAVRYITRWRVRENGSCSSPANTAAQDGTASVSEAMPATAVMVSERDVQACTGATTYAIESHNHGVRQVESGTAVFAQ